MGSTGIIAGTNKEVIDSITVEKDDEIIEKAKWEFSGQTADNKGQGSLFGQGLTLSTEGWAKATGGFQLKNITNGWGAGFEVSGLSSLGLHNDIVYAYIMRANNSVGNLNDFNKLHNTDATHMVTVQNKPLIRSCINGNLLFFNWCNRSW